MWNRCRIWRCVGNKEVGCRAKWKGRVVLFGDDRCGGVAQRCLLFLAVSDVRSVGSSVFWWLEIGEEDGCSLEKQQRIKNKRGQKLDARRGKRPKEVAEERNISKDKNFPKPCSDRLVRPGPVSSSAWIDQKEVEGAIQIGPAAKRDQRGTKRGSQSPASTGTRDRAVGLQGLAGAARAAGVQGPTSGGSSRLLVSLSFV
ncbi:hypothetical protein B0T09DRAFT_148465 [Sordaria sp. MPI-SDFR-AT-0083]|nr:hypothetical protein B0T09DRAFT_148465 [Sordaria sp. MPI-SDFR-AT-0083]